MPLSKIQSGGIDSIAGVAGSVVHKFTKVPIPPLNGYGGSRIPRDNSIPQTDEGIQVLSHTYTPAVSSSKIFVTAVFQQQ